MKRSVVFVVFSHPGFALAGLYWSQRRPKSTPVSANAILNMAADAQRDLSRVPMHSRVSPTNEKLPSQGTASRYATQPASLLLKKKDSRSTSPRRGTVAVHALAFAVHFTVSRSQHDQRLFPPGGPVYIGEGMLELMMTEDELASVLAHEIEHIDHYHCVERVQVEAKLKTSISTSWSPAAAPA